MRSRTGMLTSLHGSLLVIFIDYVDSGKATRSRRSARGYEDRKTSASTLVGLVLPPDMIKHSSALVRVAFSFLGGEDYALGLWSSPYYLIAPDATVRTVVCREEHGPWVTRGTRLSAVQYHHFLSMAETRMVEWSTETLDVEAVESAVRDELEARRHAWIAARDGGIGNGDGELKYAHDVYLVWGALFAVSLGQEWEIRKQGVEAYNRACARGELPWQKTFRHIQSLLAN